jgi:hypothetical protein
MKRLFKKWGSPCHAQTLNDGHKNIKLAQLFHWSVIIFWHNPTKPWHTCLILARFLQSSWQILGFRILVAVELVMSQLLCHWPNINSSVGKVNMMLDFP